MTGKMGFAGANLGCASLCQKAAARCHPACVPMGGCGMDLLEQGRITGRVDGLRTIPESAYWRRWSAEFPL